VVDDEPAIRMVVTEVLERRGYRVIGCDSGGGAKAICSAQLDEIDLVIVDQALPDADGRALLKELQQLSGRIRFLLSSGFPEATSLPENDGLACHLSKPFDARALETMVAVALDQIPPRGVET
jgi:DNA-binding response OmpR family regulator